MLLTQAIDLMILHRTERLCQNIERATGLTNYALFKFFTGSFAVFIAVFIAVDEMYHISSGTFRNVALFAMGCYAFYLSFFYADRAYQESLERRKARSENPSKTNGILVRIRVSMFLSVILLVLFCAVVLIAYPVSRSSVWLLAYMATSCGTGAIFWACLLLDACDPLHRP